MTHVFFAPPPVQADCRAAFTGFRYIEPAMPDAAPHSLRLSLLAGRFAVCRLGPDDAVPAWALTDAFFSVTRTAEELSLVVDEDAVPASVSCEFGFRALKLEGPFPFSLTGVLASVLDPLAAAQISIFAISTFDTDYVLVRQEALAAALAALRAAHHKVPDLPCP